MKKLSIYIIDDEIMAIRSLIKLVQGNEDCELAGYERNAQAAVQAITSGEISPDVTLLDIELNGQLAGNALAEEISHLTTVIFVTGHPAYAVKSYELGLLDFLVKPVTESRFRQTIERIKLSRLSNAASQDLTRNSPDAGIGASSIAGDKIRIKVDGRLLLINPDDILYFKGQLNFIEVKLTNGKKHLTLKKMSEMENELPGYTFIRIHRSYIINFNKIVAVKGNMVELDNGDQLPTSDSYREAFKSRLQQGKP